MISKAAVQAFNTRLRDTHRVEQFTPEIQARVLEHGDRARRLLADADLAQFIYEAKFGIIDDIQDTQGFDPAAETRRLALAHQLDGLQRLADTLHAAVSAGSRVAKLHQAAAQDKGEVH